MTEWKSQDSAPKNGEPFLLSLSKLVWPGVGFFDKKENTFCVNGIHEKGMAVLYQDAEFTWMEFPKQI